jgi:hypothetical protein
LKKHLGGTHFRTGEELKEEVFSYLRGAAGEFYDSGIKKRYTACKNALISTAIISKNRGKSKLSNNVLFNANKHVFHFEKSLGTLFYGQPLYCLTKITKQPTH